MTRRTTGRPSMSAESLERSEVRGRVLVVDGDWDTLDLLARSLRERGHHVALATDGRQGLEHAVDLPAEVVLVDWQVEALDIRTFLDVLADNPRTADAHVFVMGRGDPSELAALHARVEPIVKPFHAEEVAARVHEVIRARREPPKQPELEGELGQVALFDLLQVFAQNQRTGLLRVEAGAQTGELWLAAGRVVDATCAQGWAGHPRQAQVTGEKALFRVLGLREGQFVFHPGRRPRRTRIDRDTSHLLLEAVQRADERAALAGELPPLDAPVHLALRPGHVEGASAAVVEQVMAVLDAPRPIRELLDLVPAHDLEVLQAVAALHARGALQPFDPVHRVRLCSEEEVPAMRAAATRLRRAGVEGPVRVGVVGGAEAMTRFVRALAGIEEFVAAAEAAAAVGGGAFGPLGLLRLGGTDVELFALPRDPALRPWWAVFLAPARALLDLEGDVEHDELRVVDAGIAYDRPSGAAEALRDLFRSNERRRSGEYRLPG